MIQNILIKTTKQNAKKFKSQAKKMQNALIKGHLAYRPLTIVV